MNRADRGRAERLESILARHDGWESRTLADLHAAGFGFQSIEGARRWLRMRRGLPGLSEADIIAAERVLAAERGK